MADKKYVIDFTMSDGSTESVEFVAPQGEPGEPGYTPQKNVDYFDGEDGNTPYIKEGYWWIGETNTGVKAKGEDGTPGYTPVKGVDYFDGNPGYTPIKGVDYFDGETPYIKDGYWWIGETNTGVKAKGEDGHTPEKGVDYFDGKDGESGVHVGSNPPDTDANVWIDPEDTPTGTAEEWKFTLEDGTVVTKTIAVIG